MVSHLLQGIDQSYMSPVEAFAAVGDISEPWVLRTPIQTPASVGRSCVVEMLSRRRESGRR